MLNKTVVLNHYTQSLGFEILVYLRFDVSQSTSTNSCLLECLQPVLCLPTFELFQLGILSLVLSLLSFPLQTVLLCITLQFLSSFTFGLFFSFLCIGVKHFVTYNLTAPMFNINWIEILSVASVETGQQLQEQVRVPLYLVRRTNVYIICYMAINVSVVMEILSVSNNYLPLPPPSLLEFSP